ncbi:MAG: hypothetical protein PVH93_08085 [Nitrosopumilaceae archaeon]|jgi:hypothetical protein
MTTKNTLLAILIGFSMILGTMPSSFAAPPTLEAECEGQQNDIQSPDCQLWQRLLELEEELKAKDAELMNKTAELMEKDAELMAKDNELMANVTTVNNDMVILCENIDVTESAFMIVGGATVDLLDGMNNIVLIPVENNIVSPVREFDPSFTVPNVIPDIDLVTTEILGIEVVVGVIISADDLVVDLQEPFSGLPEVPTIPSNTIQTVDATLNDLEDCQNF